MVIESPTKTPVRRAKPGKRYISPAMRMQNRLSLRIKNRMVLYKERGLLTQQRMKGVVFLAEREGVGFKLVKLTEKEKTREDVIKLFSERKKEAIYGKGLTRRFLNFLKYRDVSDIEIIFNIAGPEKFADSLMSNSPRFFAAIIEKAQAINYAHAIKYVEPAKLTNAMQLMTGGIREISSIMKEAGGFAVGIVLNKTTPEQFITAINAAGTDNFTKALKECSKHHKLGEFATVLTEYDPKKVGQELKDNYPNTIEFILRL